MTPTETLDLIRFRAQEGLEMTDHHLTDRMDRDYMKGFLDCRHALADILAVIREHEKTTETKGVAGV